MTELQLKMQALKMAMSADIPAEYPLKTRQEMAAGRATLVRNLADSAAQEGEAELERRFGTKAIKRTTTNVNTKTGVWSAQVLVRTTTKSEMIFAEPLLDFPSDFMIAQIALVT